MSDKSIIVRYNCLGCGSVLPMFTSKRVGINTFTLSTCEACGSINYLSDDSVSIVKPKLKKVEQEDEEWYKKNSSDESGQPKKGFSDLTFNQKLAIAAVGIAACAFILHAIKKRRR